MSAAKDFHQNVEGLFCESGANVHWWRPPAFRPTRLTLQLGLPWHEAEPQTVGRPVDKAASASRPDIAQLQTARSRTAA